LRGGVMRVTATCTRPRARSAMSAGRRSCSTPSRTGRSLPRVPCSRRSAVSTFSASSIFQ
jgi:hypothetical protein